MRGIRFCSTYGSASGCLSLEQSQTQTSYAYACSPNLKTNPPSTSTLNTPTSTFRPHQTDQIRGNCEFSSIQGVSFVYLFDVLVLADDHICVCVVVPLSRALSWKVMSLVCHNLWARYSNLPGTEVMFSMGYCFGRFKIKIV